MDGQYLWRRRRRRRRRPLISFQMSRLKPSSNPGIRNSIDT